MSGIEKETKVVKLETETSTEERPGLTANQLERLSQAKKDLDQLTLELKDKKYAIGISSLDDLKTLIEFVSEKAKWKFTESLGIIEALKTLRNQTVKSNAIMIGALEIEAIYYFMSKHEGTGEKEAVSFHKILKPITDALAKLREDAQSREILAARIAGLEQGLELAEDVDRENAKKSE